MSINILHSEIRDDVEWAIIDVSEVPPNVVRGRLVNTSEYIDNDELFARALINEYPYHTGPRPNTITSTLRVCRVKVADLNIATRPTERVICSCGKSIHPMMGTHVHK